MTRNYFCSKKIQITLLLRVPDYGFGARAHTHTEKFEGTKADFRSVNSYVFLTLTVQLPAEESTPCRHQRACFILVSAPMVLCVDQIFANEVLGHIFNEKARMTVPNQKTKDH